LQVIIYLCLVAISVLKVMVESHHKGTRCFTEVEGAERGRRRGEEVEGTEDLVKLQEGLR